MLYTTFDSPIGELMAVGDGRALHGLHMQEGRTAIRAGGGWKAVDEPFVPGLRSQLTEYFAGRRRSSTFSGDGGETLRASGYGEALQEIPYGETVSYGEIARRIGEPSASRAVGVANARNPIAVVVPCHRVIGADGSLTGYGGGLERKRLLLDLEAGV